MTIKLDNRYFYQNYNNFPLSFPSFSIDYQTSHSLAKDWLNNTKKNSMGEEEQPFLTKDDESAWRSEFITITSFTCTVEIK